MRVLHKVGLLFLAIGITGATFTVPSSTGTAPDKIDGEFVLEADLHIHTALCDGLLSPISVVFHARRRGLDALAITNHNQILAAKIARAVSNVVGGPIVLVGQEITSPTWHMIGIGLDSRVDWRPPIRDVVRAVHEQGGVAIAAHPTSRSRDAFGDLAELGLDGTEVVHGMIFTNDEGSADLRDFYESAKPHGVAAIGATDHHFLDTLGSVRTYVFARTVDAEGVLEAIRAGRTVVVDPQGRAFGDADRIESLLPRLRPERPQRSAGRVAFGLVGLLGIGIVLPTGRRNPR